MTWIFFAVAAYFIAAVVSALDKVILTRAIPSPRLYAAWIGIFGLYGTLLIPFGFAFAPFVASPLLLVLSLFSGAIFIIGLHFLFSAVFRNEVSRVVPIYGALVAVFTLIISGLFGIERLDGIQFIAFIFFLSGGLLLASNKFDLRTFDKQSMWLMAAGALCTALSFVSIKYVYTQTHFLNGFIMGRFGEVGAGIFLLYWTRKKDIFSIRAYLKSTSLKTVGLFVLNKAMAGLFFLLQNYATFLGSVTLVQAMAGLQYVFLFLITIFLSFHLPHYLVEKVTRRIVVAKTASVLFILVGLFVLAVSERPMDLAPGLRNFGVTFSVRRAEEFGLDWQRAYVDILDDLGVKKLRLPAYWDTIHQTPDQFSFFELDWQIAEAERRDAEVILVVGQRLPRWPECHIPEWAVELSSEEREQKLLEAISEIVNRYKGSPIVKYWQVENEPFLPGFGDCPDFKSEFLDKEIALVRSLDNRPIVVTDSGELSVWVLAARRADVFGTTMYRKIWSDRLPGDGYLTYYLPPSFFHLKANLIKYFAGAEDIIVTELQAEPWGPKATYEMPIAERDQSLSIEQFKNNVTYARNVGFREAYLWGVEWWIWERESGRPEFWEYARTLFER
jgi:hypothetical protein